MRKFSATYGKNAFDRHVESACVPVAGSGDRDGKGRVSYGMLLTNFVALLVPFLLVGGTLWLTWWYVVIHQQVGPEAVVTGVQQLGTPDLIKGPATAAELGPPEGFYLYFGIIAAICALWQLRYYWRVDADRLEVIKLLSNRRSCRSASSRSSCWLSSCSA